MGELKKMPSKMNNRSKLYVENPFLKFLILNDPKKTISKPGIVIRKKIFPIIAFAGRKIYGLNLCVVKREIIPNDRPVIFACTHGFKEDFLASLLTVGEDFYVLFGNRKQALGCIDGFCAFITGMILVDRFDKKSRNAARNKIIYALKLGAKVAIFPEGTWNNSPNKLVLNLYPGIWDIAKKTHAWIVPIATLKGKDRVYSSIGKAIDVNSMEKDKGVSYLRDIMATLKWNLMEEDTRNDPKSVPHGYKGLVYWNKIIDKEINSVKFFDRLVEQECVYDPDKNMRFNSNRG